jgi:hypothetical protein
VARGLGKPLSGYLLHRTAGTMCRMPDMQGPTHGWPSNCLHRYVCQPEAYVMQCSARHVQDAKCAPCAWGWRSPPGAYKCRHQSRCPLGSNWLHRCVCFSPGAYQCSMHQVYDARRAGPYACVGQSPASRVCQPCCRTMCLWCNWYHRQAVYEGVPCVH